MTGRERLAKVLSRALTAADAWIESAEVPRLTDAALAHIAAVLRDDATVEAVMHTIWPASAYTAGAATEMHREATLRVLAVLAERLGVPHVDR